MALSFPANPFQTNQHFTAMMGGDSDANEKLYLAIMADLFGDDGKMTEEEFRSEMQKRIAEGKEALLNHEIEKAFDLLFVPALVDVRATRMLLMILNQYHRVRLLTEEQIKRNKVEVMADRGFAIAQYAMGRFHQHVKPENDSIEKAKKWFGKAKEAGLGDAFASDALFVIDGYYGQVDMELYDSLVKEGLEKGYGNNYCSFSLYRTLREYIFGHFDTIADPQRVADFIKSNLGPYESEDIEVVDPAFYRLLGDAYSELGNKNAAIEYYSKAADMGYIECFSSCLLLSVPDENSTDKAWEIWKGACRNGCDFGDPLCYFMLCTFNKTSYDDLPDEEKPKRTAEIEKCLYQSYALGDEIGALQLGNQYYYGWDGFEENAEKAWEWFSKAAYWEDSTAYAMLAQMIEEGYAPENYDQECANLFHLQAYRRGETDELKMVVKLYQSGYLAEFAKEIETLYIPKYEQQRAENPDDDIDEDFEDDDYEDDDGRYDAWA